jgi:hypothetical protein
VHDAEPSPTVHRLLIGAGLRSVLVDRVTVEVHDAFVTHDIPCILLKGPAIARWLYGEQELRVYSDSDFLIPRDRWTDAGQVLKSLGFESDLESMAHPRMESFASDPWVRYGLDNVDLHSTVYGIGADFDAIWQILSSNTVPFELDGATLQVLALPARTMHVALHAGQHQEGKAVMDLERAVAQVPERVWWDAVRLAQQLSALPAFAAGLRLVEGGADLAAHLGIDHERNASVDLRAGRIPLAESLNELWETPGILSKLRYVRAELFPKPDFMRWWSPLAKRGALGLAAAYLWRPVYLLIHTPPAAAAVWRARRGERIR